MENLKNLLMRVREALAKDPKLSTCLDNIYMLENDGALIISGSVPHASLKTLIKDLASSVAGIKMVMDDIKVEPGHQHRVGVQIDWASESMVLV